MSTNLRQKRHFKNIFLSFIFLIAVIGITLFFLIIFFISGKPLFISPVGKMGTDLASVKKTLKNNDILFSEVILSDYSYIVNIQNNGQVRLSQVKDIGKQVTSLQRILRELTIEGRSFKSIDFRFAEPVIVF